MSPKGVWIVKLSNLLVWSALLGLCAALFTPSPPPVYGQEAPVYGSQLALIAPAETLPANSGIAVHGRLIEGEIPALIASGPAEALAALLDDGFAVDVLEFSTAGRVYYWVDAQSDPSEARRQTEALGRILLFGTNAFLVALDTADETRFVETLPAAGIGISLLSPASLPPADERAAVLRPADASSTNPTIAGLLSRMTEADLSSRIAQLSGEVPVTLPGGAVTLATRYTFSSQIANAERFLFNYYTNLGLSPVYAPWTKGSYSGRNVVVDLPGTEHPERIWVLGGHFDTNSEIPYTSAPGADDNGTGTAAVMRAVELLKDYRFADTIRFVHFSGEEQGQWGAQAYARDLRLAGIQVQGFINLDMFGWDSNGDRVVELHPGTGVNSNSIATAFISANERYAQGLSFERKTSSASRFSDHSAFWDYNYPAFLVIENFFTDAIPPDRNPWYHSTGDRLSRVNLNYAARIARTALATIAELAGIRDDNMTPTVTPTLSTTPTSSPTAPPHFHRHTHWDSDASAGRLHQSAGQQRLRGYQQHRLALWRGLCRTSGDQPGLCGQPVRPVGSAQWGDEPVCTLLGLSDGERAHRRRPAIVDLVGKGGWKQRWGGLSGGVDTERKLHPLGNSGAGPDSWKRPVATARF